MHTHAHTQAHTRNVILTFIFRLEPGDTSCVGALSPLSCGSPADPTDRVRPDICRAGEADATEPCCDVRRPAVAEPGGVGAVFNLARELAVDMSRCWDDGRTDADGVRPTELVVGVAGVALAWLVVTEVVVSVVAAAAAVPRLAPALPASPADAGNVPASGAVVVVREATPPTAARAAGLVRPSGSTLFVAVWVRRPGPGGVGSVRGACGLEDIMS